MRLIRALPLLLYIRIILSSLPSRLIIGLMLSALLCVIFSGAMAGFLLQLFGFDRVLSGEDDVGADGVVFVGLAFIIMAISFPFWFWLSFKVISRLLIKWR